jgi:hypothetical protein
VRLRDLLVTLRDRDVRLAVAPAGRLRFDAPEGAVTPGLRVALRARRAQLLALVRLWGLPHGPLGVLVAGHRAAGAPPDPPGPAADPRPDLVADSRAWAALLGLAHDRGGDAPGGAFGALHGCRCLGTRLERTPRGWRLSPGAVPAGEWAAIRREWLLPRAESVAKLLAALPARVPPARATVDAPAAPAAGERAGCL